MKNIKAYFVGIILSMSIISCDVVQSLIAEPTALETLTAVKEVMNSSAFRAIKTIKQIGDGNPSSILPKEVNQVLGALKTVGMGGEIDKATRSIAGASKVVANEGTAIMSDAIRQVDIKDAAAIVLGGQDAATEVLRQAMYATVKKRYSSRLDEELGKSDIDKYWSIAAGAYNMFGDKKIDGKLSDFLAERAVDGLFLTMGKEEKKIRTDYNSLGKQVVTKVWDYYTKKS